MKKINGIEEETGNDRKRCANWFGGLVIGPDNIGAWDVAKMIEEQDDDGVSNDGVHKVLNQSLSDLTKDKSSPCGEIKYPSTSIVTG